MSASLPAAEAAAAPISRQRRKCCCRGDHQDSEVGVPRAGGCMQGSATTIHHRIAFAVALATAWVALAGVAQANPILSGYGGPGEGSQTILGATLIGGPPSSGGRPAEGQTGSSGAAVPAGGSGGAERSGTRRGGGSSRHAAGRPAHHPGSQASANQVPGASGYASAAYRTSAARPVLGVSGEDLLIMLAALIGIAMTGLITRRLAQRRTASRGIG